MMGAATLRLENVVMISGNTILGEDNSTVVLAGTLKAAANESGEIAYIYLSNFDMFGKTPAIVAEGGADLTALSEILFSNGRYVCTEIRDNALYTVMSEIREQPTSEFPTVVASGHPEYAWYKTMSGKVEVNDERATPINCVYDQTLGWNIGLTNEPMEVFSCYLKKGEPLFLESDDVFPPTEVSISDGIRQVKCTPTGEYADWSAELTAPEDGMYTLTVMSADFPAVFKAYVNSLVPDTTKLVNKGPTLTASEAGEYICRVTWPHGNPARGDHLDSDPVSVTASLETLPVEQGEDGRDYYLIGSADALMEFAALVNGTLSPEQMKAYGVSGPKPDACGKLTANIDLNPGYTFLPDGSISRDELKSSPIPTEWTPMGSPDHPYTGVFDGGSKTIRGIYLSKGKDDSGLFSVIGTDGKVSDLTVTNSHMTGMSCLGGIAGQSSGTISNCSFSGYLNANGIHAGGIVGQTMITGVGAPYTSVILNCRNDAAVYGLGYVGGIAGSGYGLIQDSVNSGTIVLDSVGIFGVGGIAGLVAECTVKSCSNEGTVRSASAANTQPYVGGIVGTAMGDQCLITDCHNSGDVSAPAEVGDFVGGIMGCGTADIKGCSNKGNVSGHSYVGGAVGWLFGSTTEDSYNTGTVSGTGSYVGGFVGGNSSYTGAVIARCYNSGEVNLTVQKSASSHTAGGFVGLQGSGGNEIKSCYNVGTVTAVIRTSSTGPLIAGGFAADSQASNTNSDSYNTGKVSVERTDGGMSATGGFVSYNRGIVKNCWTSGDLKTANETGKNNVGAFAANLSQTGSIENSYYREGISGQGIASSTGSGAPEALPVSAFENTGEDGLLAKLSANGSLAWNTALSAMGKWEYGKPALLPALAWQQVILNAPVNTVTIPAAVDANVGKLELSATAGALTSGQRLTISVAAGEDLLFKMDGNPEVTLGYTLSSGDATVAAGGAALICGNTAPGSEATATLTITPDTAQFAGRYTDTLIFTVAIVE